jgi:MFS family permease
MANTNLDLKSKNISVIYGLKFLGGLVFFLPILALYFEEHLFTITNVALIFSIGAIAQAIFEVPTGAIADLFGRKKTYMLAKLSYIVALIFLIIGGNIIMFILFAIVDAFSKSLKSGTDSAIMYDTLKDENKEHYFKKVSGTASAISHGGIAIGSIASGYLAAISLSLPIKLTLIPAALALILTIFLEEPKYEKEEENNILMHLKSSAKFVFGNKQMLLIIAGMFFIAAAFDSIVALNPLWYRFKNIPIEAFGWISAIIFSLAALGYHQSHNFSEKFGDKRTIILTVIFPPMILLIATFFDKWLAVFFAILTPLFFGLRTPVLDHLIHKEVASSKRATVYSVAELVKKFALAIFAPFAGYVAELWTINVAFQMIAVMLFIVPILYLFLKEK